MNNVKKIYESKVGSRYDNSKKLKKLTEMRIYESDRAYGQKDIYGYTPYFITGTTELEVEIGYFPLPIIDEENKVIYCNVSPYTKRNISGNLEYNLTDTNGYTFYLSMIKNLLNPNSLHLVYNNLVGVYSKVVLNIISKLVNLTKDEENTILILISSYYLSIVFDRHKVYYDVLDVASIISSKVVLLSEDKVSYTLNIISHKPDLDSLIDNIGKVLEENKFKKLTTNSILSGMSSILPGTSGNIYGSISTEVPEVFSAIVYVTLLTNSYSYTSLGKLLKLMIPSSKKDELLNKLNN